MTAFYAVDDRRFSLAECWRFSPSVYAFLVFAFVTRALGRSLTGGATWARIDHLDRVAPAALPDAVRATLQPRVAEIEAAGLAFVLASAMPSRGPQVGFEMAWLAPDGLVLATAIYAANGPRTRVACVLHTRRADETVCTTSDASPYFEPVPGFASRFLPRLTPLASLWAAHQQALAAAPAPALPMAADRVEAYLVDINNRAVDHHAARGVLVPLEGAAALPRPAPPRLLLAAAGPVLLALAASAVLLAGGSAWWLLAFVAVGGLVFSRKPGAEP